MAVPYQRLITEHKLDHKSLKSAFDKKTIEKRPEVKKLVDKIRDCVRTGIERNRRDYRLFKAMDWAFDTPFYQVSYTQLRHLIDNKADEGKVREVVNSWGLTHLLPTLVDETTGQACCDTNGKPKKALNLPVFFNIFVPIVMAYITVRWAKLFNDRNVVPLFKYEPVQFTKNNRFICEVITQVVQRMSAQFDYPADTKQTILQTLLYGFCINFPRESWFSEKQEDDDGKEMIVREGLRFNMPHPTRTYYDLFHRLSTLNSNSGCQYAGYWQIARYGDLKENDLYWNKEDIQFGAMSDWFDLTSDFLENVFPCVMKFPTLNTQSTDRETEAANTYGSSHGDAATLETQHFHRIVPKEYGLGKYDYPVWFRFVMASDNAVLWAEPLSFDRFPTYTYDADFNRSRFKSLALEIIPFQDHISNLMTQWILAVKENLGNVVFYDKEKVPVNYVQLLQNMGQKVHNGRLYVPFSSTENIRMRVDQREAFFTPQLTHHPTAELANLVTGVLNMLDRIMQLSPQEIGQAAPHEQTAEESRIVAGNTSTRVTFTGSGIDSGDYAKKVMIYDAMLAHADDDVTVGIASTFAATDEEFKKLLKAVGFELTDKENYDPELPETMHEVTGKKEKLKGLEFYASTRDNANRINLPAIASAMSQIFQAIANNPILIQAIGPMQLVELLNQVIYASGMPHEFRLQGKKLAGQPPEEQADQLAETLKTFAEQVNARVTQSQQETLAAAAQQSEQMVGQAMQAVQQQAQQQSAAVVAQAVQAAQAIAPAVQQAQSVAAEAAQTINRHEVEINSLNQAVAELTQAVIQAQQAQQVQGLEAAPAGV